MEYRRDIPIERTLDDDRVQDFEPQLEVGRPANWGSKTYNVNAMTRTLLNLKKDGLSVTPEALRGLSPYRTEHINLLGDNCNIYSCLKHLPLDVKHLFQACMFYNNVSRNGAWSTFWRSQRPPDADCSAQQ